MTREEQILQYANSFKGKGMESDELKEIIRLAIIDGAKWADAHPYQLSLPSNDEAIKTAEDHAYFAGKEKLREELLVWAENMKRICKGAEPIVKAYQTVIDKIQSL